MFSEKWQAMAREGEMAAEHMAIGVTALGRANYAQLAYYGQAFFALSIGLERTGKLAVVVDHALEHGGRFPAESVLRKYCHDLGSLLQAAEVIGQKWRSESVKSDTLPQGNIHRAIIRVLGDFATNVTRYYNLDVITDSPRVRDTTGPVKAWREQVVEPVVKAHLSDRQREVIHARARQVADLLDGHILVRHTSETGALLNDPFEASAATGVNDVAQRYCRMYVMQILRFLSHLMSDLTWASQAAGLADVPYLAEYYTIFNNDDRYFRKRKTWSIHR
jgi:hypothetical protein